GAGKNRRRGSATWGWHRESRRAKPETTSRCPNHTYNVPALCFRLKGRGRGVSLREYPYSFEALYWRPRSRKWERVDAPRRLPSASLPDRTARHGYFGRRPRPGCLESVADPRPPPLQAHFPGPVRAKSHFLERAFR